jgi:hypothetical protein
MGFLDSFEEPVEPDEEREPLDDGEELLPPVS